MKIKKICVLNHSHTDIGYTENQEIISDYHIDFIRQAMDIIENDDSKTFNWMCENYWQIENFFKNVSDNETKRLIEHLQNGTIDYSLNYLNMTELAPADFLKNKFQQAKNFSDLHNLDKNSAMTCDINGVGIGYHKAMYESGIRNYLSNVHTHHGYYTNDKSPCVFYWENYGNKILTIEGIHYHLGNELGLCPGANATYVIDDDFSRSNNRLNEIDMLEDINQVVHRIQQYLKYLENIEYELPILPIVVSGMYTDNGGPNKLLIEKIFAINELLGEEVTIEISTLDKMFKEINLHDYNLPVYKGDWNDWWADGIGSTPSEVKILKSAIRKYDSAKLLNPDNKCEEFENNVLLYTEHTWGYSSSISEPWNYQVKELELRNTKYAVEADIVATKILNRELKKLGKTNISATRKPHYRVVNPTDKIKSGYVDLFIEGWENFKLKNYVLEDLIIINQKTKENVDFDILEVGRGRKLRTFLTLEAKESLDLVVEENIRKHCDIHIADGFPDYVDNFIENDYFKLTINKSTNTVKLVDKETKTLITNNDTYGNIFDLIYCTNKSHEDVMLSRRSMGRRRHTPESKIFKGEITDFNFIHNKVEDIVTIKGKLQGTKFYELIIKFPKNKKMFTINLRLAKEINWDYESLFLLLPSNFNQVQQLYINKCGETYNFNDESINNRNLNFSLTENGIIYKTPKENIVINLKDTPLIYLQNLNEYNIDHNKERIDDGRFIKSWIMNNYWETNFKADLSGFYEFDYSIKFTKDSDFEFDNIDLLVFNTSK